MKSDLISRTELLFLPEITLVLFGLVFLGALVWIFRPGARRTYAQRSLMPLEDDRLVAGPGGAPPDRTPALSSPPEVPHV